MNHQLNIMKPITLFILSFVFSLVTMAQLTYNAKVPNGTQACYIGGEFNNWQLTLMNKVDDNTYTLAVANATNSQKYKYCSGPAWTYVEKSITGYDIPNRTYTATDVVAKWALLWEADNNGPTVPSGTIKRFLFNSNYVDARIVDVWLPAGYTPSKQYAVLYMQDGQNLFDASTNTFNGVEWTADETATKLLQNQSIRDVIIVGPWNNGAKRYAEYFPQKCIDNVGEPERTLILNDMSGTPKGDDYLKFLVQELKPYIDKIFSTKPDQQNTFVMGSSMGGLISMYAICEYPDVFSGAGCMSTHWTGRIPSGNGINLAFNSYMRSHLPSPNNHKFYFDHGTLGFDAMYGPMQLMVDTIMLQKGYTALNFESLVFPGEDHNETSWAKRLNIPFEFLLKNSITAIQELNVNTIELYPNPAKDFLIIKGLDISRTNSVIIYNEAGRRDTSITLTGRNYIDISHLLTGVYFANINGQKKKFVKRE